MYPQLNRSNKYFLWLFVSCLFISITTAHPIFAHQVQISEDVGATIHIEPNDNPRAGEPTQAWFALTRKGGQVVPLTECDCELLIYAEPHTPGEPALIEPSLEPVTAERYEGIPGAEITFPRPGRYQLQLIGKPATEGSFQPFEFEFEVTVAGGTVRNPENVSENNNGETESEGVTFGFSFNLFTVLAVASVLGLAIVFVVMQMRKGG